MVKKNLLLLFVAPLIFSCNTSNNEIKEEKIPTHSYTEVKDKTISFKDSFKQKDNLYYIYCFSHVCDYCEQIRDEVIDMALKKTKMIYFCSGSDVRVEELDPEATIGCKDIEDLFIGGYPSLIEIKDATVTRNLLGKTKVIEALRK